jgi:hypothetical protein
LEPGWQGAPCAFQSPASPAYAFPILLTEEIIMLARARKAVMAGVGAGVAAVVATLTNGVTLDADGVAKLAGIFLAAAIPVGWATWRIPNAED